MIRDGLAHQAIIRNVTRTGSRARRKNRSIPRAARGGAGTFPGWWQRVKAKRIDNVLVRVQAARVKGVLRSTETVARLAQDQFAMILDNLTSHQEVTAIVEKLQATVGLPLTLDGHELFLTCRIGVALYPQDAAEPRGVDHTGHAGCEDGEV